IVANKVFSPQYLMWVLPFLPLVDFRPAGRRLYFLGVVAMTYVTMRIFPDCFVGEIVYCVGSTDGVFLFDGPTPFGIFLLLVRNTLCIALTAAVAWHLYRAGRPEPATAGSPLSYLPPAA